MEDLIKVIICETNKPAYIKTIRNDLGTLQGIVDGYIEVARYKNLLIICNEEGMIYNLPKNRLGILGNFIVCDSDGEEFASIDNNEIDIVLSELNK